LHHGAGVAKHQPSAEPDRITVTLANGQRKILERIASENGTTLAFVVRYALKQFIKRSETGQLKLEFPPD
jgi:hypothetical protein